MKRTSTFSAAGAQPNARGPKCRSMQNISKDNSEKEKPVMTEKNDNEGTPSDSTSVKLSDRPFGELSYEERRQALERRTAGSTSNANSSTTVKIMMTMMMTMTMGKMLKTAMRRQGTPECV